MRAIEKATLFIETFGWGCIPSDPSYFQLTLSFVKQGRWLNQEEELLLKMLGAINVHAENLNTACCGDGGFRFEDDEGKDTLPIPQPSKSVV